MIRSLLYNASHPGGRDIRPNSLKLIPIEALMGEVVKGNAHSLQLAAKCIYRPQKALAMDKIYSLYTTRRIFPRRNFPSRHMTATKNRKYPKI